MFHALRGRKGLGHDFRGCQRLFLECDRWQPESRPITGTAVARLSTRFRVRNACAETVPKNFISDGSIDGAELRSSGTCFLELVLDAMDVQNLCVDLPVANSFLGVIERESRDVGHLGA